jgi:SulP family sulfate permease
MRNVPFIDSTGIQNFREVIKILQNSNIVIILSGVNSSVYSDFNKNSIVKMIGESNIYDSFEMAINHSKNCLNQKNPIQAV